LITLEATTVANSDVVFLQGINTIPSLNVGIWIYSPPSYWSYTSDANGYFVRDKACLFTTGLKLWIIGGNTDKFEIWIFDILLQSFTQVQGLGLYDIPRLLNPGGYVTASGTNYKVLVQGGYSITEDSPSNQFYTITVDIVSLTVSDVVSETSETQAISGAHFFPFDTDHILIGGKKNSISNNNDVIVYRNGVWSFQNADLTELKGFFYCFAYY